MVYFHTKNLNLGKFWSAMEYKMLVYLEYLTVSLCTLWPFDTFYGFWYIFGIFFGYFVPRKIWQPFYRSRGTSIVPANDWLQCDQIGRNFTIWAIFFGVGRIFF
jgi:hypothetical protein